MVRSGELLEPAHRLARQARRRLVLHRRGIAAVLVGVAAWLGLTAVRPPEPATTQVLVAASDLPAGTRLAAEDLDRVALPPDQLPDGRLDDAVGELLAAPVRRGELLTDARVLGPGLTLDSPDSVALSVRITDVASLDLVRVGDAVDVIAVPALDPGSSNRSRVLVTGARVLALPPTSEVTGTAGQDVRVVVLEVARTLTVEISESAARDWLTVALAQ